MWVSKLAFLTTKAWIPKMVMKTGGENWTGHGVGIQEKYEILLDSNNSYEYKKVRQCWQHSLQSHLEALQQIRAEELKHEDCISCTR